MTASAEDAGVRDSSDLQGERLVGRLCITKKILGVRQKKRTGVHRSPVAD